MLKSLRTLRLGIISILTIIQFSVNATVYPINVTFSGLQETPSNSSARTGTLVVNYADATNILTYTINFSGLSANVTAAHFHAAAPGIAGAIVIGPAGFPTGVTSGTFNATHTLTATQEDRLKLGLWYFNIHTTAFPGGEIRAQIFLQDATFVLPDISCPANINVNTDPGVCTANVSFAAVTHVAGSEERRVGKECRSRWWRSQ